MNFVDTSWMEESALSDGGRLRVAIQSAQEGLTERASLVEALFLAAVAGEHVLIVGPPGTAKSEAVRRVAAELGGEYFEYLFGRFTEPNEVFGPVDLRKLREGVVEVETAGMLPEAEVAFLDEVFLGSTAILNTLLGILNERTFRRGATVKQCPLRLCVGATNSLPDDVSLAAFADRFLVSVFVEPVPDPVLEELLEAGWRSQPTFGSKPVGLDEIDRLSRRRQACDMAGVRPVVGAAIRRMRAAGIELSDRRAVRCQNLIAAAAALEGRSAATEADLWPLPLIVPTAEGQVMARSILSDLLATSQNRSLPALAEELSAGPVARSRRLVAAATELGHPDDPAVEPTTVTGDKRLRIEAVLREIDAGFVPDSLPPDLASAKQQLTSLLSTDT